MQTLQQKTNLFSFPFFSRFSTLLLLLPPFLLSITLLVITFLPLLLLVYSPFRLLPPSLVCFLPPSSSPNSFFQIDLFFFQIPSPLNLYRRSNRRRSWREMFRWFSEGCEGSTPSLSSSPLSAFPLPSLPKP